jgi:hypothetical protein
MAFIFLTVGKKGAGKSLRESRMALRVMNGYYRTEKKYPLLKKRIFFSKQKFSKSIEDIELFWKMDWFDEEFEGEKIRVYDYILDVNGDRIVNNPEGHLFYWDNAYQLKNCPRSDCWKGKRSHPVHNADIFWDEIGNDIPQNAWAVTPDWMKQIFSHARKRGVRIYANTQKYEMVDINFRRQVDIAYWLIKLIGTRDIDATRPDPKFIFVWQMIQVFDPMDMENEADARNLSELRIGWPQFAYYTKRDVQVFDTTAEVPPWVANKMTEVKYQCVEGDNCADPKHREIIKHVPL